MMRKGGGVSWEGKIGYNPYLTLDERFLFISILWVGRVPTRGLFLLSTSGLSLLPTHGLSLSPTRGSLCIPTSGYFLLRGGAKDASSMGLKEGFCIFALGI